MQYTEEKPCPVNYSKLSELVLKTSQLLHKLSVSSLFMQAVPLEQELQ